jgi:hypothetical protein
MNPHQQFCHNQACRAYGRSDEGHIVIHSQKERRYRCKRCGRTFSETKGSALYRMHKPTELVLTVVTLLAYGCPVQAIVAAFSLDENARWPAGRGRPALSVGECTSTSSRQEGCSFYRSPGRRDPRKSGRWNLLAGLCVGGEKQAVVGWHRKREP